MADSIILATARLGNHKIITGDEHFRDLNEAIMIGIIGGSLGVISGIGLSFVMSAFVGGNIRFGGIAGRGGFTIQIIPWFSPMNLLYAWLLCVLLSIVAGFYPAWRASRLDPVVALRHE